MGSAWNNPWNLQYFVVLLRWFSRSWHRAVRSLVIVLVALGLNGCVQSDVGVRFDSPYQGEIVQQIHWSQSGLGTSDSRQTWLQGLFNQARQLKGRVQRINTQDWIIHIPFSNAADLETSFNQFFQYLVAPTISKTSPSSSDLPPIQSHLTIQQSNLLLFLRSQLTYDIDLRSLGITSIDGDVLAKPTGLVDLTFHIQTPWGARPLMNAKTPTLLAQQGERTLTWELQPGQLNHIEAIFWMPNPLGIGTLGIITLVILGLNWQKRHTPDATQAST